jgi:hypothetical protein
MQFKRPYTGGMIPESSSYLPGKNILEKLNTSRKV